jgi:hypothetical protein
MLVPAGVAFLNSNPRQKSHVMRLIYLASGFVAVNGCELARVVRGVGNVMSS